MKAARRIAAALLIAAIAVSASGCWDYNDPEDLIYVLGITYDRAQSGRLHATIEYATMKGGSQTTTPAYLEIEGDTFYDTQRNAIKIAERPLNWSHMQVVVVSQEIAKKDIPDLLDMLLRLPMIRESLVMLVSKEATASEILEADNPSGDLNTNDIMGTLKAEKMLEKAPYIKLYQFADSIADEQQSAILPAIGLANTKKGKYIEVSGSAVFRGPWLQGFLDEYDTRAVMMLDFGQNMYDLPLAADPGGKYTAASVQFTLDKVDILPEFENGKATLDIYVSGNINIVEISGATTDPKKFCTVTNAILTGTSTALENSIVAMIRHTQQMDGCDVLEIGNHMKQSHPEIWRQINGKWRACYNNMDIVAKADLTLRNTGDQMQPLTKGD